jgi:UDP-3-O-[3-hydroxymyristoyl] glucosamine N-acyltransferase
MRNRNTSYPLSHLAEQIKATVIGDSTLNIKGLCTLEAPIADHITFIRSESPEAARRAVEKLPPTCAVILSQALSEGQSLPTNGRSLLLVDAPYHAFLNLIPLFFEEVSGTPGIHPTATVDPTATIDEGASIGPGCYIGPRAVIGKNFTMHPNARVFEDVSIGNSVTLHSGVAIRHGTIIKDRVTIHDNAVIGADGFGYTPDATVGLRKVPQVGNVRIESDVEIGANACIDRGAFGPTIIGRGTKIDNLSQIGHNVVLGNFVIVCGQVGIAGSCTVGDGVVLGGQVGVADHITINKGIRVGGGSGVTTNLSDPGDYMGYPALLANDWRRIQVSLRKLIRPGRKK